MLFSVLLCVCFPEAAKPYLFTFFFLACSTLSPVFLLLFPLHGVTSCSGTSLFLPAAGASSTHLDLDGLWEISERFSLSPPLLSPWFAGLRLPLPLFISRSLPSAWMLSACSVSVWSVLLPGLQGWEEDLRPTYAATSTAALRPSGSLLRCSSCIFCCCCFFHPH